jgi:Domain of unknown function (DUF5916)/Carbohydrate family 9 binding domain-like
MTVRVRAAWMICLLLAGAIASAAAAQEAAGKRVRVPFPIPRTTEALTLDGAIAETLWERALMLPLRYEVQPGENIDPPVRTEMLIAYDDVNLYVGFRCHDDDPSAIRARFTDRDSLFSDDFVGIVLDTFNDERRAFEFFANPLGVQADMLMDDVSGNEDSNWNAIWESAGRITDEGYEVEFLIPLTQLRFETTAGDQTWGIDGIRSYPRRDRHHITLFPRLRGENTYLGQEEKISGFSGIQRVQNLEVVPTLTAVQTLQRKDADPGLTVKWGVTPNVTLNATVNPDFSQIEADAVQLDVNTQFALFFPETRPFFLEGSDLFRTARLNLLHTRQVVQPDGALKISGKTGRHAFGVFSARDETTTIILPGSLRSRTRVLDADTTATVGRYRADVGDRSTVGAMVTDRRGGGYFNNVVAFDSRYRMTSADSVSATVALATTQDEPGAGGVATPQQRSDTAIDVFYDHSVRSWNAYTNYTNMGRDFRADVGFITQVDTRRGEVGGGWTWHGEEGQFYNRINVSGNVDQSEEEDGSLLEREWEGYISYNGPRESFAYWGGGVGRQIWNGIRIDRRFQSANAEFQAAPDVRVGSRANWGGTVDFSQIRPADVRAGRTFVNVSAGRHVSVRFSHNYELLDVAGGRLYSAHVPEVRIVYQRDLRTMARVILQYSDVTRDPALYTTTVARESRDVFTQLLFSYKVNAQTALYFGYVSGASATEQSPLTQTNRTVFGKVSYAWLK